MPLTMAKSGEQNVIKKITGRDEVRQHLGELGFSIGERVTVICQNWGNMILSVKGCRIALNREMAGRIII